jgi:hypothetical protein
MNTFNSIGSFIKYVNNFIKTTFIYNFPAIDPSLVLYYPLDNSSGIQTANYASKLPVYDASMIGSSVITYTKNNFITSIGDLSLNNTMGDFATSYVTNNTSFIPNISGGFSISLWFSCSGELGKTGTLITLPINGNIIEIDISNTNVINSGWQLPVITDYAVYYPFTSTNGAGISFNRGASISSSPSSPLSLYVNPFSLRLQSSFNQYVVLPPFTNTGSQVSISIWYNQSSLPSGNPYMYSFENGDNTYIGAYMNINSNLLMCFVNSGNVQNVYTGTLNDWTHFVWLINGNKWTVYINGVPTNYTVPIASTLSSTSMARRVNIGCSQGDTNICFNGYLSDFRVYNRLLHFAEVKNIYNRSEINVLNILRKYTFSEYLWLDSYVLTDISLSVGSTSNMYNWLGHNGGLGTNNPTSSIMSTYITSGINNPYVIAPAGDGSSLFKTIYRGTYKSETLFFVVSFPFTFTDFKYVVLVNSGSSEGIKTARYIAMYKDIIFVYIKDTGSSIKSSIFTKRIVANTKYLITISINYNELPHVNNTIIRLNGESLTPIDDFTQQYPNFTQDNSNIPTQFSYIKSGIGSNYSIYYHEVILIGGTNANYCFMSLSDINTIESYLKLKWNVIY